MKRAINHAALAAAIRRDAAKYGRENRTDDPELRMVIARDVLALHAIADLVEQREMRRSYRRLVRLDTAVRDSLTRKSHDAITGGCAPGHSEHD